MVKAVFVLGPESSGTRLMTRLLIRAGCTGDDTHFQPFDTTGLPPAAQDVVWRRSLPHGGAWPDVAVMIETARGLGYDVRVVFMHREIEPLIASQLAAPHVKTREEALANINRALESYAYELPNLRSVMYEQLIADGWSVMLDLLRWLDLTTVMGEPLYDGNAKYTEG